MIQEMSYLDTSLTDEENDIIDEVYSEFLLLHPVYNRFKYVSFVSKSKGHNKLRRKWKEVELISDNYISSKKYVSWHKFGFDIISTEVYPEMCGIDAENRLIKENPLCARRI